MTIERAVETIEYKIAADSDRFNAGASIKMEISSAWPPLTDLSEALRRRNPAVAVAYDYQVNDVIKLIITKAGG
jgi:hypothetical protein